MLGSLFRREPKAGWRAAPCLADLDAKDLDRLAKYVVERRVARGERLVEEDDAASELFLVAEGALEVYRAGDHGVISLGRVAPGDVVGEVALFDRGPRSATVRALSDAVVYAVPFSCFDGKRGGLSAEGRASVLARVGADLAARVRAGGDASAVAHRHAVAMGEFLVSVMTLQCIYAITLTLLPFVGGLLPASTTYVSLPLQLVFGAAAIAFIVRTRMPLRTFGLGLRDLFGSLGLSIAVTAPLLAVATLLKWVVLVTKGSSRPVFDNAGLGSLVADPRVQTLFVVYVLSCVVQEVIVRCALQSSLHVFLSGKNARVRAIAVCALVFATNHLHMSAMFAAAALVPGIAWGWLFERKRNVVGVVLSHVAVGAFVFFVLGVNVG